MTAWWRGRSNTKGVRPSRPRHRAALQLQPVELEGLAKPPADIHGPMHASGHWKLRRIVVHLLLLEKFRQASAWHPKVVH